MRSLRPAALTALLALAAATPARADATAFIGADTTPANRPTRGVSVGTGLAILGFEIEYARASADGAAGAPSLTTGTGSILLQTPGEISGFQPYLIAGAGLYRERLGTHTDTSLTTSTGGGVKITLVGPVRLRVDYRVFKLGSGALYSPAHRIYAGLNLKF
jgi:hypothetical protein